MYLFYWSSSNFIESVACICYDTEKHLICKKTPSRSPKYLGCLFFVLLSMFTRTQKLLINSEITVSLSYSIEVWIQLKINLMGDKIKIKHVTLINHNSWKACSSVLGYESSIYTTFLGIFNAHLNAGKKLRQKFKILQ